MKKLFNKNLIKKNIIAVVALIEIIMISAVSVFAWTETISSLKILTQNDGVVDSGINNTANINAADTAINLDSYFSESGNVHLASCSSPDGKDFYFPVKARAGSSTQSYRKGNLNDRNANYISFSLKIKAESADRTFYFRQAPTIKINGQTLENTDNSVRMAFFLDNNSKGIFANSNANAESVNSISGDTTNVSVKSFSDFLRGKSELFTVNENRTATLTVSLWLEDPGCTKATGKVSVEGLEIIAVGSTRFTFADRTSAYNDQNDSNKNVWQWIKNDNAKMWMYDGSEFYEMKNESQDKWYVNVLTVEYTEATDICFYRTSKDVTSLSNNDLSDKNKVYNKWTSKYQTDKTTYTAYGAAYDNNGNCRGTWDDVTEITLNAENTANAVLPVPGEAHQAKHIALKYNDISVQMSYYENRWRCYIPTSVTGLDFEEDTDNTSKFKQSGLTRGTETAYTVTSKNTGYWGTGVLVNASVDSSSSYGTVKVTQNGNDVTGYRVTKGTSVTFTATANNGYQFKQWTAGSVTSTSSSVTVTANSDLNYVASFTPGNCKVTVYSIVSGKDDASTTGGTVQLASGGTADSKAEYTAHYGENITLENIFTQEANSNYTFVGWYYTKTGTDGSKIENNTQITVSGNLEIYAIFKVSKVTVYFDKSQNSNWGNTPYIYVWDDSYSGDKWKAAWPGTAMTKENSGLYSYTFNLSENGKTYTRIIFNNNNSPQTANIELPKNAAYVKYVLSTSDNTVTRYLKNDTNGWEQK
ncbi:MAG: starch-binding protein [Ruminococcus sp.]